MEGRTGTRRQHTLTEDPRSGEALAQKLCAQQAIGARQEPSRRNANLNPILGGVGGRPPRRRNAPCWSATSCSPTDSLRSTIGARGLNFRVRNGTGCASPAMVADQQGAFQGYGRAVPSGPHSVTSDGPRGPLGIACMKRRARPISTARLNASQRLHLRPIELVVYEWPYRRENSSRDWLPA